MFFHFSTKQQPKRTKGDDGRRRSRHGDLQSHTNDGDGPYGGQTGGDPQCGTGYSPPIEDEERSAVVCGVPSDVSGKEKEKAGEKDDGGFVQLEDNGMGFGGQCGRRTNEQGVGAKANTTQDGVEEGFQIYHLNRWMQALCTQEQAHTNNGNGQTLRSRF